MDIRKVVGVILILLGVLIAYHAITIFDDYEYKALAFVGQRPIRPFFEIAVALGAGIPGLWLLLAVGKRHGPW